MEYVVGKGMFVNNEDEHDEKLRGASIPMCLLAGAGDS